MGLYSITTQDIINEVYFGSSPRLEALITQLGILRRKHYGESYLSNISVDPELIKFNRMIEDFFGFKCFSLNIINMRTYNAFTVPVSCRIDTGFINSNNIVKDKEGYRFNETAQYSVIVFMSSGLICDPDFTDREILAVLFHEIGHNFSSAFNGGTTIFDGIMKVTNLITLIPRLVLLVTQPNLFASLTTDGILTIIEQITEKLSKEHPELIHICKSIFGCTQIVHDIKLNINLLLSLLISLFNPFICIVARIEEVIAKLASTMVHDPLQIIKCICMYDDEKFADAFPTFYGLGSELISGINKMRRNGYNIEMMKFIYNIPSIGVVYSYIVTYVLSPLTLINEHPGDMARLKSISFQLEREINKSGLDPKMKKEMQLGIKNLNNEINKIKIDAEKDESGNSVRATAMMIIYNLAGGDIREILTPNDKRLDKYDTIDQKIEYRKR